MSLYQNSGEPGCSPGPSVSGTWTRREYIVGKACAGCMRARRRGASIAGRERGRWTGVKSILAGRPEPPVGDRPQPSGASVAKSRASRLLPRREQPLVHVFCPPSPSRPSPSPPCSSSSPPLPAPSLSSPHDGQHTPALSLDIAHRCTRAPGEEASAGCLPRDCRARRDPRRSGRLSASAQRTHKQKARKEQEKQENAAPRPRTLLVRRHSHARGHRASWPRLCTSPHRPEARLGRAI